MVLFVLGTIAGALFMAILLRSRAPKKSASTEKESKTQPPVHSSAKHILPSEEPILLPIEILPNMYELALHNITMKHHITPLGKDVLNYVTVGFRFSYHLNGRKEGKRRLIVSSYNAAGELLEIKGDITPFVFTDAGADVMKVCFNNCDKNMPARVTVSVREGAKD